jgi:hypothetical protein
MPEWSAIGRLFFFNELRCKRENDGVEGPVDEPLAKICKRENDGVEGPVDEPPAKRCLSNMNMVTLSENMFYS